MPVNAAMSRFLRAPQCPAQIIKNATIGGASGIVSKLSVELSQALKEDIVAFVMKLITAGCDPEVGVRRQIFLQEVSGKMKKLFSYPIRLSAVD